MKKTTVKIIVLSSFLLLSFQSLAFESLTLLAITPSFQMDSSQIQITLSGTATTPKVFKTENPARIVLDFENVKNGLNRKTYPINQNGIENAYIMETKEKIRIILNLNANVPYQIKTENNDVFVIFPTHEKENFLQNSFSINKSNGQFDFKQGDHHTGRISISLANPNEIVKSNKKDNKVVITFPDTQFSEKHAEFSNFDTPVKYIDVTRAKQETVMTVTMTNSFYDYSVLQVNGLLTIEVRPLEKQSAETTYKGKRVSLNFQDVPVRNVLAVLAEFAEQNIVVSDEVSGNITLQLNEIPWDEALDFIMITKELGKYETGHVTLISPLEKIRDYKEKQQEMDEIVEKADTLLTEYIKINYAKAENFKLMITGQDSAELMGDCSGAESTSESLNNAGLTTKQTKSINSAFDQDNAHMIGGIGKSRNALMITNALISERGSVIVDSRTNTLIIKDTAKKLEDIKKLVKELDVPIQQVMIESRIVIADDTFAKNLGVKFGLGKQGEIDAKTRYAVAGKGTNSSMTGTNILNDSLVDLGAEMIGNTPVGALGMTLARGADYVLNLEVQALQNNGRGESISNPRVMTMNRCTAHIIQGVQVPYVTLPTIIAANVASNSNLIPTVTFKDAALALNVTPQITPSGAVLMNLTIKKDNVNEAASVGLNGNKVLDKREIQTSVLVEDGETIVLGGVYEDNESLIQNKVPFFADLPLVGDLFANSSDKNNKKELLIFVTPKIIKDDKFTQQ